MSKRKTDQATGSKKKAKSNLEDLSGQLDKDSSLILRDMANVASRPARMAAPAGVERFSDDDEDFSATDLSAAFKKADRTITAVLKVTGEKAKRKNKVEQMQAAHISDSEEDEGVADQMEVTARQQANALQAEEGDPEPAVVQQVLFPTQLVNPPQCNFEGVEGLMDGCSAQLQSLSASAAGSVDLPSSLLLNGWLQRYCFTNGKQCSASLVQSLFQLLALSNSLKVATAAYKTLMALLGDTHQQEALTGCLTSLPTVSGLYSTPPQPPRLEAVPTDQDFIAALKALGLNPHKAAKADDSNQTGVPRAASLQLLAKGTMYHFQLLLRTFAAVCNYKQQGRPGVVLARAGLQELLLLLLALRMDPVGQLLAIEIQIALDALLKAFSDPDWHHCFSQLASQVLGVGPSHRAHLVALKLLPAQSPRGFTLQQAAVAMMLQELCSMSSKAVNVRQASRQFSAGVPVSPEDVIETCSWFQAGGATMAKACQGEQGDPLFSLWEAETCIKAAGLLLWPHIKLAKETGQGGLAAAFKSKWQDFIQALSRGLSNSHKVAAPSLKLHIAVMQAWDR